jgi:hypothetical protein
MPLALKWMTLLTSTALTPTLIPLWPRLFARSINVAAETTQNSDLTMLAKRKTSISLWTRMKPVSSKLRLSVASLLSSLTTLLASTSKQLTMTKMILTILELKPKKYKTAMEHLQANQGLLEVPLENLDRKFQDQLTTQSLEDTKKLKKIWRDLNLIALIPTRIKESHRNSRVVNAMAMKQSAKRDSSSFL